VLATALAILFSSPDDQPTTVQSRAKADPADFLATAVTELNRTSEVATYGPPYNSTSGSAQKIGPVSLQEAAGVKIPIETANEYVIEPLTEIPADPRLKAALGVTAPRPPSCKKPGPRTTKRLCRKRGSSAASRCCRPGTMGRSRR
jgi:hypothetical protein